MRRVRCYPLTLLRALNQIDPTLARFIDVAVDAVSGRSRDPRGARSKGCHFVTAVTGDVVETILTQGAR